MTLEEVQADLVRVDTAYAEYLNGERQNKLVIGTGSSRREYGFQDIDASFLLKERTRLVKLLETLAPNQSTSFRNSFMQMGWRKL